MVFCEINGSLFSMISKVFVELPMRWLQRIRFLNNKQDQQHKSEDY